MEHFKYDVAVIGTGPGGEGAAMKAAKEGKRVAVIEKHRIGGGCTHWGTIPSKALRHSVSRLIEYKSAPLFREKGGNISFSFPEILRAAESVIERQVKLRSGFYQYNNIDLIEGTATFTGPNQLTIAQPNGANEVIEANDFVLATGSRPYQPDDIDFNHPRVYDSDKILTLGYTPRRVIVYGAGVIGTEYASIFRGLGVKVDLINNRDRLLSFLDDEISDALSYHLRISGVVVRHNETYDKVIGGDDGVELHLKSGKKLKADIFLFANGRTGNTQNMGLEDIGLHPDRRGQLKVDQDYRTELPHIHAVGDIIGYPSLASAAYDQGRFAASAIIEGQCHHQLVEDIPTGIYTIPEISSVGRSESELTDAQIPYEVGHAFFKDLARAQIAGQTVGMLKLLFNRDTKEILGIHCFGERAAEIVHIGQAIMCQKDGGNSLDYFVNTTFNYPTMAEAYRVAALNGLNRLF
ncbi:Si-specific NAD(P)(+) transhydrogenase [Pelagibaculum spongiae]|uniref:Soluble pyridine nucleotide transhydrogenase n=1 Tax=Pelagibaculum spongiae TaxID=2080658 RepID=A0A2V1GUQ2_9GAMM|nr:Si-specific NAD(P)(+) transhydrogenase [Pelagibaculum spongiae]PVZ69739.1 Si-specific NAD(P)(+) transhydrogenase [Pelagibaculum spongiae]